MKARRRASLHKPSWLRGSAGRLGEIPANENLTSDKSHYLFCQVWHFDETPSVWGAGRSPVFYPSISKRICLTLTEVNVCTQADQVKTIHACQFTISHISSWMWMCFFLCWRFQDLTHKNGSTCRTRVSVRFLLFAIFSSWVTVGIKSH